MNAEPNKIALVVHACDRYEILFQGFEHFFRKFWPETDGVIFYFFTEQIAGPSRFFQNIKTGHGDWSDRLRRGLEQLSEPRVIYLQEDMWFNQPLNPKVLGDVLAFSLAEELLLLKLHSSEVYQTRPTRKLIGGLQVAKLDNRHSKFLMSHQPSVWNREFFISQLSRNEHPWRNERVATRRLKKLDPPLYQIDLLAENGKPPINDNVSNEFRSEYQSVSVNGRLNANARPFIGELMNSEDPVLSAYGRRLQHHFIHQITHDGLPPPKKTGAFKKIISLLR